MGCFIDLLELPKEYLSQTFIGSGVESIKHVHYSLELFFRFSAKNMAVLEQIAEQQLVAVIRVVRVSDIILVIEPVQFVKLFLCFLIQFAFGIVCITWVQYFL
jgi:hypothetical protein